MTSPVRLPGIGAPRRQRAVSTSCPAASPSVMGGLWSGHSAPDLPRRQRLVVGAVLQAAENHLHLGVAALDLLDLRARQMHREGTVERGGCGVDDGEVVLLCACRWVDDPHRRGIVTGPQGE